MSTGQPPSDSSSGGENRSKSGQSSETSEVDRTDPKDQPSSSLDDSWALREAPTSTGRTLAGSPAASRPSANSAAPEFRTVPPGVSSPRGKFTVGNLLNASQGAAPISQKKAEPLSVRPRQQIGALPQRVPTRSSAPPPNGIADPAPNLPAPPLPSSVADVVPEVEAVSKTAPSQPIAGDVVPSVDTGGSPTPSQPFSTPPQPFAVAKIPSVDAGASPTPTPTPSQPFAVEVAPEFDVGSRPTPSQPFSVEAVPKVEEQTSRATGARVELAPQDLLAPPLIEKTPRGIGAVTLNSPVAPPSRPSSGVAAEAMALAVAPIVSVAAAVLVQPAKSDVPQPPAPTPGLDDPDSWDIAADTATPAIAVEPPAPVAIEQPRTSDRSIRVSPSDPSLVAAKRSPSSHSKLASAVSSEALSGEFFAAPDVTDTRVEVRQRQDSDDFIDERQRRSISPEVVARRRRYRALVIRVIVGFVVLLLAAIALKVLRKH